MDIIRRVKTVPYVESNTPVSLSHQITTTADGCLNWILTNNTNTVKYVSIWRGLPGYSPIYFFGGAFASVYLANGVPVFGQPGVNATTAIGFISSGFAKITPAFIFTLQPRQSYSVMECGFPDDVSGLVYTPVIVNPTVPSNFIVFYDRGLVTAYEDEAGEFVSSMPNPFLVTSVYVTYKGPYNNLGYFVIPSNTNNLIYDFLYGFEDILIRLRQVIH